MMETLFRQIGLGPTGRIGLTNSKLQQHTHSLQYYITAQQRVESSKKLA